MSKLPRKIRENNTERAEITRLRAILHGVFNGDPKAKEEGRTLLYGPSPESDAA